MAFTQITLVHSFATTGGFLTAVLSEPMTNGALTIPDSPQNFQLQSNGELSAVLNATDDPGTTTASGNPPMYSLYLQLPGAPQVLVVTAIPSGAVLRVLDWDQLPLANGDLPPAAPQVIMSLNDVLVIGSPLGPGYVLYSTSATEAQWGTLTTAGIQPAVGPSNPLAITAGGTGNVSGSPGGPAGGDLSGTYPGPQVTSTHLAAPLPVSQGGTGTTDGTLATTVGGDLSGQLPNPAVTALSGVNVFFPQGAPDSTMGSSGAWAFSRTGTIYYNQANNWIAMAQNGAQGVQGNQGSQGTRGNQGVAGSTGPQGDMGYQGPQGSSTGTQGPQGHQGDQGPQGPGNYPGPQGSQGWQGAQGWQGDKGDMGPGGQGPQGPAGVNGVAGAQGPQGVAGAPGGPQGVQGATGPHGSQGSQGATGSPGVNGTQGAQGAQGAAGPGGSGGAQGTQGNQGAQGGQGPQGAQGTPGDVVNPLVGATPSQVVLSTQVSGDTANRFELQATGIVAVGDGSNPTVPVLDPTNVGIALGPGAVASGAQSMAVGANTRATAAGTMAIGTDSNGTGANATVQDQVVIGTALTQIKVFGMTTAMVTPTGNYNMVRSDSTVLANGAVNVTLPNPVMAGPGAVYRLVNIAQTGNTTVLPFSTETINWGPNFTLEPLHGTVFTTDGANWYTALTIGAQGSQGNQGSQGAIGSQGSQGAQGDPGPLNPTVVALTDGPTIIVDALLGNDFRVTITGNQAFANPINGVDGQEIRFQITQGAGGGFNPTWGSAYWFGTGLPLPDLATIAGETAILGFVYNESFGRWLFIEFVEGFS